MEIAESNYFLSGTYLNNMFLKNIVGISKTLNQVHSTLSGRIGKVVASHAAVEWSIPADVALIYNMHEALRGYCP